MSFVLLVTGGRSFVDGELAFQELDRLALPRNPTLVLEGGQRRWADGKIVGGADYWANRWAAARGIRCQTFRAHWRDLTTPPVKIKKRPDGTLYNALAGPARNARMINMRPHLVIALPGGDGTRDCIKRAKAAGIAVIKVAPRDQPAAVPGTIQTQSDGPNLLAVK